jgi:uncharacterized membrane protein
MSTREDALIEAVALIRGHGLTLEEIAAALKTEMKEEKSSGILTRIFGYIGGIFIFAGIAIFIGMHWDDFGSAMRVMLTLGTGFSLFVLAVAVDRDGRFTRTATPLFIIAALMEPSGIIVALKEYSRGGDPAHGILFMNFVMLAQQGLVFMSLRRTFLALSSVFFGTCMFAVGFDLLEMDHNLIGATIGVSLCAVAWALGESKHRPAAGFVYFIGSALFMAAAWDWLEHKPLEILILGLSCGLIVLSTVARSRALLTVGTLSTLSYIGYFTARHFADSDAWPLVLMLTGIVMIGLSALAVKLNKKYISGAA